MSNRSMKKAVIGGAFALAALMVPALGFAGPNCTNTCTRFCGQVHDPESLNYSICFEGCIHGCTYGPEMPTLPGG